MIPVSPVYAGDTAFKQHPHDAIPRNVAWSRRGVFSLFFIWRGFLFFTSCIGIGIASALGTNEIPFFLSSLFFSLLVLLMLDWNSRRGRVDD